ncbi:hypothetical protein O9G_000336 [Rozella allomycis CSF55]|uniref:Uncharacterized protein n=1 Tax=Rozella allomycis (strain CSF55) TaxID=988480 RepID=A0A075ATG7_ROZAC|nr:hypothetical protein O9G_000336 [Rozella allomycis CSF55]|eukprot:EPZ33561.1 hypothetical protein O9G_000336 [Rozella allomycis CSF55]
MERNIEEVADSQPKWESLTNVERYTYYSRRMRSRVPIQFHGKWCKTIFRYEQPLDIPIRVCWKKDLPAIRQKQESQIKIN